MGQMSLTVKYLPAEMERRFLNLYSVMVRATVKIAPTSCAVTLHYCLVQTLEMILDATIKEVVSARVVYLNRSATNLFLK